MTVAVTFLCPDGVVIAVDSMLTPFVGTLGVGHHTGRKVYGLPGEQLFAWAGDLGLCMRFKTLVEMNPASLGMPVGPLVPGAPPPARVPFPRPLDYGLLLSQSINGQFNATQVPNRNDAACFIAFAHNGQPQCCAFTGGLQPFMFDTDHYYMALGSGKLSADPFLGFLVDVFCSGRRPNVREAIFLATWTVKHTIDTASGGVAPPIRVGVLESVDEGFRARELPDPEIDEHVQAVKSGAQALREWRDAIQSGEAAEGAPPVPEPDEPAPPAPPAP